MISQLGTRLLQCLGNLCVKVAQHDQTVWTQHSLQHAWPKPHTANKQCSLQPCVKLAIDTSRAGGLTHFPVYTPRSSSCDALLPCIVWEWFAMACHQQLLCSCMAASLLKSRLCVSWNCDNCSIALCPFCTAHLPAQPCLYDKLCANF